MANIILVEDDFQQLRLYTKFLISAGHHVAGVVTPHDLTSLIEVERFDLCISDVHLGNVNPQDWIKELGRAQRRASLPVLMISSDLATYEAHFNDHNINHTLAKPFDKQTLLGFVDQLV